MMKKKIIIYMNQIKKIKINKKKKMKNNYELVKSLYILSNTKLIIYIKNY